MSTSVNEYAPNMSETVAKTGATYVIGQTARMPAVHSSGRLVDERAAAANRRNLEKPAKSARAPWLTVAKRYAIAALGCAVFAFIYAQFSHGVYSPFMTFMFAIPLVGGAAIALGCRLSRNGSLPRSARQAWALAIASLTVASCLRGIFDIAGTASPWLIAYIVAAVVFAAIGFACFIRQPKAV